VTIMKLITALTSMFVLACAGTQPPPPENPTLSRQIQDRLDAIEERLDKLESQPKRAERQRIETDLEETRVATSIERIERRLAELDDKIKSQPPAPTPTPKRKQRKRPDAAVTYSVPIAGSPALGRNDAWVTMVVGYDYGPFVQRVGPTIDQLRQDYGRDLRVVYRSFNIWPQKTKRFLLANCAAHKQGQFKAMYDELFHSGFSNRKFDDGVVVAAAKKLGLRMSRFRKDWNGSRCDRMLLAEQSAMRKVGMSGTPAFFINGRFLSGARPLNQFKKLIDEELAKAKRSGIRRADYYKRHVLRAGVKSLQ